MSYRFNDNTEQAIRHVTAAVRKSFSTMAVIGKAHIDAETPEKTGYLKSQNTTEQNHDELLFVNEADYAVYVEYGTYKTYANPFMRRGIANATSDFARVIEKNLKV